MSILKRTLGLSMLVFYGTGMILGAGIYSIIGKAAVEMGPSLWLGFVFAGVCALMTALSYAELSALFPKSGAEFVYLREAFKNAKWIGGTAGIAMAFSGAATAATVALAFAGYLNQFYISPAAIVASGILVLFTGLAIVGIKESAWFTVVSTLIEVGGLIFIIYLGWTSEKFGQALENPVMQNLLPGSALIMFSYFGFENIVTLAEETKKPERDLPRALLICVLIATTLYVLVSLSAVAMIDPKSLGESTAPMMTLAQSVSQKAGRLLGAIALFSTANTALISLIGGSRILFSMGEAKILPKSFALILPQRKTPWVASIIILVSALLLIPLGKLETVAAISSLATMLAFFAVNVALISLRYTQKNLNRPFKVALNIGRFPLIAFFGAVFSVILITQFEMKVYLISGGFLFFVAIALFVQERFFSNNR